MKQGDFEFNKVVLSLSGGLDSSSLLLYYLSKGCEVRSYSFYYGQKHSIELEKVQKNIKFLQNKGLPVTHQIIDLRDAFSDSNSSLHQGGEAIPHGDYRSETMKSTVIENRNIIFSSIIYGKALAWANKTGENVVISQGIHAGDHCFTGDTKIFTPRGLKTINELNIGDEVFSFDTDTLSMEVDKCIDIIEKGTNDEIYNITTSTGKIQLTGLHNVYVIERGELTNSGYQKSVIKKQVKDLKVDDILISSFKTPKIDNEIVQQIHIFDPVNDIIKKEYDGYNLIWENDSQISIVSTNGKHTIPFNECLDAESLLNLMAWYITEGWSSNQYKRDKRSSKFLTGISQSSYKNYENCEIINNILNKLNIPISYSKSNKGIAGEKEEITYQFSSVIAALMKTAGDKSINKHIPEWIMNFMYDNPAYINEFLYTMVSGDGHYDQISGMYSYQSNSFKLIEDVSVLAKLAGFYVRVCYPKGNRKTYNISFGTKDRKIGLVRYGDSAMSRILNIEVENKFEKVYDISVQKNHNFFAGDLGGILISNSIYPDCTPESQEAARYLYKISNWGSEKVDFEAPFVNIDKGEVLAEGLKAMKTLGWSDEDRDEFLRNTHTCYDPDPEGRSCGKCGSCTERLEAFEKNGLKDPVPYQE